LLWLLDNFFYLVSEFLLTKWQLDYYRLRLPSRDWFGEIIKESVVLLLAKLITLEWLLVELGSLLGLDY
jgi:hypothetical protein